MNSTTTSIYQPSIHVYHICGLNRHNSRILFPKLSLLTEYSFLLGLLFAVGYLYLERKKTAEILLNTADYFGVFIVHLPKRLLIWHFFLEHLYCSNAVHLQRDFILKRRCQNMSKNK